MSTPTAAIWTDATNDAIGNTAKKAASPAPNSTDSIWTAAVNDARGVKTPNPPAVQKPSDFEASQDEVKRLAESGAGPAAAYMKPGQTATALGGMLAAGSTAGLFAPSVGTATVGTGILGPEGAEITKDVATQGPSIARAGINAAVGAMRAHPIITSYVASHLANALGIPLPKVVKAIMLIPGAAE